MAAYFIIIMLSANSYFATSNHLLTKDHHDIQKFQNILHSQELIAILLLNPRIVDYEVNKGLKIGCRVHTAHVGIIFRTYCRS